MMICCVMSLLHIACGLQFRMERLRNSDADIANNFGIQTQSRARYNVNMHDNHTPHELCIQFFQDADVDVYRRMGEALHPGPPWTIRTFNPAQMLGHESDLRDWPTGVWTAAETNHTSSAMQVTKHRLKKENIRSVFGPAVQKHSNNAGVYRGRAMGTAIFSTSPMHPYPEETSQEVNATCRFNDVLVRINQHLMAYVAVVYGPPESNVTYTDGDRIFNTAMQPALERATHFQGPAAITGDFNRELSSCRLWTDLQRMGWHDHDAAQLAHDKYGQPLDTTCKDCARKSFILINGAFANLLVSCFTVEKHLFEAHPVLQAVFDFDTEDIQQTVWALPKSLDDYLFDDALLDDAAEHAVSRNQAVFNSHLEDGNIEDAFKVFHRCFQYTFEQAAITTDGHHQPVARACWKRGSKKLSKQRSVMTPVIRQARHGDWNVDICQGL